MLYNNCTSFIYTSFSKLYNPGNERYFVITWPSIVYLTSYMKLHEIRCNLQPDKDVLTKLHLALALYLSDNGIFHCHTRVSIWQNILLQLFKSCYGFQATLLRNFRGNRGQKSLIETKQALLRTINLIIKYDYLAIANQHEHIFLVVSFCRVISEKLSH